jgi:hypothetical protein
MSVVLGQLNYLNIKQAQHGERFGHDMSAAGTWSPGPDDFFEFFWSRVLDHAQMFCFVVIVFFHT